MSTGGEEKVGYSLVIVGTLTLEDTNERPNYNSIVTCQNKIIVVDINDDNVKIHQLHDGKFLDKLDSDSRPRDICLMDATTICVLHFNGLIEMASIKSENVSPVFTRMKSFRLNGVFNYYYSVVRVNDNIVVVGVKQDTTYWCITSLDDGHVDTIHRICKKSLRSYVATKDNIIYISCDAGVSDDDTGVYVFDILNPSQCKYKYKHERLDRPRSIVINEDGNIFVCNHYACIYQLTASCQLVAIFTQGLPWILRAMFWDNGRLYVTRDGSPDITVFRHVYQGSHKESEVIVSDERKLPGIEESAIHKSQGNVDKGQSNVKTAVPLSGQRPKDSEHGKQGTGLPVEILNMDDRSIQLFENALKDGKEKVYSIRVMVVGHQGVGKTTLIKRLLGKDVNISERLSTEGIDVHLHCCDVSLSSHEWTLRKKESEQDYRLQRLAKVLIEKQQVRSEAADEKQVVIHQEREITDISAQDHVAEEPDLVSPHPDLLKTSQQIGSFGVMRNLPKSNANTMVISEPGENVSSESRMKDPNREILQLLQKNAEKIKHDLGKYAPLTMWDFAGQYAFYTTHQMFLSRRAIYLLVSDLSGHIDDMVDDDFYFDEKGKLECRVHELFEVWMNSVHSCAPPDNEIMNSKVIPPPVILVGTHADAIQQGQLPPKRVKLETQTMTSDTVHFTLPTTSTHADTATNKQLRPSTFHGSMHTFRKPLKSKRTVEKPTTSRTGAHPISTDSQPNTQRIMKKRKVDAEKEKLVNIQCSDDYRHEICENYFREIRSHLKDKPSRFHLVEEDFDIDNTVVDSKLEGLKRKIVEVASRQSYWGEEIPAKWLPLEQVLMNLRAQGHKVIHRSLLENINQAGGVQISTDELDLFLRFQHEIGAILYFSTELLKEKIVLEPQWMINALKSLITAEMFVLRHAPLVTTLWDEFRNGKLYPELIDALWTKDADLHDNKEHILLLMEQLNIIAKPKFYIDDESEIKEVNYFFAPCMLHAKPPREVIFPEHHEQMESSSVMCYVFTGKFLPAPIFHRLLAACVAQWPLATKKMETTIENQIFCGCGVFQIDKYHKLILLFSGYIIFMRVTRQGIKDKTPSSKLCIEVKEFIAKVLNKIIGYLGHSLKFEEFIQCPDYNGESVNSLIPVALLKENAEVRCDFHDNIIESNKFLKFWFDDEVKNIDGQDKDDVDTLITQEHINHARLCNALNTVCSNALREILLTNVPMPHTDIYKAILANKAKLNKLNKDQIQLVFPDPQGLSTGKVEEFDISLLYAIIRNVSSVPAPSNGWGKPPTDNPRDTTLGASVERIRTYRNHISGHSVDGKISQQEFEDYWAKIDEVLREIEIVIGNHGYLEDLEKRKNQAITPHEARELQKTFQEYKKQIDAAASDIESTVEILMSKVKELRGNQN